jgi:hypothetical protein
MKSSWRRLDDKETQPCRNHQEERDARPLHLCPACLLKLCWNLRVEPVPYLMKLKAFCQQNGINPETDWYEGGIAALAI